MTKTNKTNLELRYNRSKHLPISHQLPVHPDLGLILTLLESSVSLLAFLRRDYCVIKYENSFFQKLRLSGEFGP